MSKGESLVKNNYSYLRNVKNTRNMFAKGTTIVVNNDYNNRKLDFLDLKEKKMHWLEIIRQTRMEKLSIELKSSKLKILLF